MSNPDGSVYHHNPGQQVPSHPPQPQPAVFTPQFSTEGQVFQGQQNMSGQPVRYVYPVNYSVQTPSGQNQQATVSMETPTQTFNPNMGQYPTQYAPSYPNYQQGGATPGQSLDNYSATNFSQNTYPTPQGDSNVTGYTSYPVQYSQSSFGGQSSSAVFYSTVPASNPQLGLSYGGQQQVFSSSTPPSQSNATNPTVAIHNIPAAAQQPVNVGQPPAGNTPTATTPQYMYSTMPQFGGQPRSSNPQLVQFHNVQGHNPTTIPFIRNMQFNMQIPTQAPGIHGPTTGGGGAAGVAGQPSQVTISAAKAFSIDNQVPKVESGADNKDFVIGSLGSPLVAGPPRPTGQLYRPPAPMTSQDMRFIGQTQFRPSLQPVQYHSTYPQQQKQRPFSMQTNSAPKPQRIKKSRSKDGSHSSQSSMESSDVVNSGNTLEVYDLPSNMSRSEADKLLSDLVCAGAQLQYVFNDNITTDTAVDNMTVSDLKQVLAIFPNVTSASQTLQNHSNAGYKLRVAMTTQGTLPPDNIGGSRC
ncbi:hypothetical protein KUTeg_015236 [Tegillarca granosa]|uniref:RRM domain-containing protein n=1 Tax=Tegillarca granosa TaxID=220873 RepID=A0ABQ9EU95_TEGGR|nr:hypothetical protein KUTeg_015236 [Tegillarca granosa]